MERTGYNGWTNYETWNVKLWMDNDEGSQGYWQERTEDVCGAADDKDEAIYTLSEELKHSHHENMPEVCGTYADLLGAALSSVNWYEIAESMIEDFGYEDHKASEDEES